MEIYIDSPMMKAGLQAGDVITGIAGTKITDGKELQDYMEAHPLTGEEITLTVERNGKEREVTAKPQMRTVVSSGFDYNLYREKTGFLGVLKYSAVEVRYWITSTVQSLGLLIKGTFSVNDLSGPVGIVDAIGDSVQEANRGQRDIEHADALLGDPSVANWRYEPAAHSGTGRRSSGIPHHRGHTRQRGEPECGGYDTLCGVCSFDAAHGVCPV